MCKKKNIHVIEWIDAISAKDNAGEPSLFARISGSFQTNLVGLGDMVIICVVSRLHKKEL
jgi:hypothetical protein